MREDEWRNFYLGFSNEVIWPLFHDLQSRCNFVPKYWQYYQRVNRKFAGAIERISGPDDLIWIHDYQLMQVAGELRARRPDSVWPSSCTFPFRRPTSLKSCPGERKFSRDCSSTT